MRRLIAALLTTAAFASPATALTITGRAEVIDSDLFLLEGYRVYLLGAESVEDQQPCLIGGQQWECYPAAVRQLETILDEGPVTCEVVSGPNFLLEVIARCVVNGTDVGERFIRSGFAIPLPAETDAYAAALAEAQAAGVGFWQGMVAAPAEWRAANGVLAGRPTFRPVTTP
jgi:endonuclease YncB( thermonuclease family)